MLENLLRNAISNKMSTKLCLLLRREIIGITLSDFKINLIILHSTRHSSELEQDANCTNVCDGTKFKFGMANELKQDENT